MPETLCLSVDIAIIEFRELLDATFCKGGLGSVEFGLQVIGGGRQQIEGERADEFCAQRGGAGRKGSMPSWDLLGIQA
ncbi:MAG: hypothetical protein A2139_14115 [Desulfobacca sp. RBG_16_60_12]|nr:MAG: hypothetical protein A2139_14115 [Desulfobacca sp. RBG_16_60_12]